MLNSSLNFENKLYLISDGIAKTQDIMSRECEMKEQTVSIEEEILPGSTAEDTVYVQGENMKMESKPKTTTNL